MPATVADRQQAERELRNKNQKILDMLPEELKDTGPPICIFNVSPKAYLRSMGSMGHYLIPACPDGAKHSAALKVPRILDDMRSDGMFKLVAVPVSGKAVVNDIVGIGEFHSPGEDLTKWGVFVAAGQTPTDKELAEANRKLNQTWDYLITEADNYWKQGPQAHENVSDLHRLAAEKRGVDKEWAREVQPMKNCHVCGNRIMPTAAICTHCKTVLDEASVIANKVPGYEHLWGKDAKKNA